MRLFSVLPRDEPVRQKCNFLCHIFARGTTPDNTVIYLFIFNFHKTTNSFLRPQSGFEKKKNVLIQLLLLIILRLYSHNQIFFILFLGWLFLFIFDTFLPILFLVNLTQYLWNMTTFFYSEKWWKKKSSWHFSSTCL